MDVEKTIEFILEQQAQVEAHLATLAAQQVAFRKDLAEQEVTFRRKMDDLAAAFRQDLRRAVRLGIQEARAERKRRREMDERLDEKITQLASAQLVTEEKLQRFLDSQQRGNGSH